MVEGGSGPPSGGRQVADEAATRAVEAAVESGETQPVEVLPPQSALPARDLEQDIELKGTYARWLLRLMTLQLFVANGVFVAYAWAGRDWKLSESVIDVWLGATFVQIVTVVYVVVRYLFPRRDAATE